MVKETCVNNWMVKKLGSVSIDMPRRRRENILNKSNGLVEMVRPKCGRKCTCGLMVVFGPSVGRKEKWHWAKGDVRPKHDGV